MALFILHTVATFWNLDTHNKMSYLLARPIYGASTNPDPSGCSCVITLITETGTGTGTGTGSDPSLLRASLENMLVLINTLKVSIQKYLPAVDIGVSLRGNIATPLSVPTFIMVRLLFSERYPKSKMDKTISFYRSTIRDLYFELGRGAEWTKDPLSLIRD